MQLFRTFYLSLLSFCVCLHASNAENVKLQVQKEWFFWCRWKSASAKFPQHAAQTADYFCGCENVVGGASAGRCLRACACNCGASKERSLRWMDAPHASLSHSQPPGWEEQGREARVVPERHPAPRQCTSPRPGTTCVHPPPAVSTRSCISIPHLAPPPLSSNISGDEFLINL